MSDMLQHLAVALVVFVATVYLGRALFRAIKGDGSGCGTGCGSCPSNQAGDRADDKPLVTVDSLLQGNGGEKHDGRVD